MDAVKEAKELKSIDSWEDMERATKIVNALALIEGKEANKQFERLTNLLANCTLPT